MPHFCGNRGAFVGSAAHPFAFPSATEHYAPDRALLAEHQRLEVELDFERRAVSGLCVTRVRAVCRLDELTFDAVDLDIERVTVDGAETPFTNSRQHLRVRLTEPLAAQATATVAIRYRCRPSRGLYFWGPDAHHPERPTQAWTQGQDEDSRCWFPCLDAPHQRASTELVVTFPARLTALSNGRRVADEVRGELRTQSFRLDFPHAPYLVTLVVGELEELVVEKGGIDFRYLFPPGRQADALRAAGRTPEMLEAFVELTGQPYPFQGYAQVFVTEFTFGGMENTSATTLTDAVLIDERAHLDYSAEPLVAHELAHQWFGDLLTCREWPHAWLNEGFATYFEVLWKERALGRDEADWHRRSALESYLEEVGQRYARPIVARRFEAPIDLFDSHLYEKGALVLHELRRRLGDDAFFLALRRYVAEHRGDSVETVDWARAIERATGRNLDGFFAQYVHAPGHPELKVECRYEPEARRVRLAVRQTQKTGDEGWPVFRLPLEVRIVAGGRSEEHRLELTDAEHVFSLAASEEPAQLVVDPRREVLGTLEVQKPFGCWREELKRAPEAAARIEAATALAKEVSSSAVEALTSALRTDPFWGVQVACARALGRLRTPLAKRALLDSIDVAHPKARRAVVAALGEFKADADVGSALARLCEKGDESCFVEGEAARALGKLQEPRHFPLLDELLRRSSFQDAVAVGAVDGFAASLHPDGFARVEPLTASGRPLFLRRAATRAVAKLAEVADRKVQAVARLSELVRDEQLRVQLAAIEATVQLGDRRLLAALDAGPFPDRRAQRAAREAARALREGAAPQKELAALKDEVDRLKEEVRALKEKVESSSPPPAGTAEPLPPPARRRGTKRSR